MIFTLTILVLSNLISLRYEVQSIYFYYFSARNQEKGVNFLKLRTVMMTGVENMDNQGHELEKEIEEVLKKNAVYGKSYGQIILLNYKTLFNLEMRKKKLEFFRGITTGYEINKITKMLLGKKVTDEASYNQEQARFDEKIDNLEERPINSGYAFVCLSTFTAVKQLEKHYKE